MVIGFEQAPIFITIFNDDLTEDPEEFVQYNLTTQQSRVELFGAQEFRIIDDDSKYGTGGEIYCPNSKYRTRSP